MTTTDTNSELPNARPLPDPPDGGEPFAVPIPDGPHPLTRRSIWLPIAIVLFVLNIPFLHLWLRGPAKTTTTIPFSDDFNRTEVGPNYFSTGGLWRPVDGWLYSPGVKNNPLWLQAKLPHDVVVEFDAKSDSAAGDVKCEIFGNGRDHASGYILVFGGWNNTTSIIGRLDEHEKVRPEERRTRVERGRVYHWKIVREGGMITWYVDGQKLLERDDKEPLYGPENDRFGFGTWATDAYFDNLEIHPLH